jgi:Ca2+/Na+ antiporter
VKRPLVLQHDSREWVREQLNKALLLLVLVLVLVLLVLVLLVLVLFLLFLLFLLLFLFLFMDKNVRADLVPPLSTHLDKTAHEKANHTIQYGLVED